MGSEEGRTSRVERVVRNTEGHTANSQGTSTQPDPPTALSVQRHSASEFNPGLGLTEPNVERRARESQRGGGLGAGLGARTWRAEGGRQSRPLGRGPGLLTRGEVVATEEAARDSAVPRGERSPRAWGVRGLEGAPVDVLRLPGSGTRSVMETDSVIRAERNDSNSEVKWAALSGSTGFPAVLWRAREQDALRRQPGAGMVLIANGKGLMQSFWSLHVFLV